MVDTSKMVFGDQFQIKLDPAKLEAKSRKQWGQLYVEKQFEKSKLIANSSFIAAASAASFVAGIEFSSFFFFIGFALGYIAMKSFYSSGYQMGILDDWETKTMIRVDK